MSGARVVAGPELEEGHCGLIREETVRAIIEHFLSHTFHDGATVLVEVAHHGVGVPATKELDVVRVNLAAQEGHRPTRP